MVIFAPKVNRGIVLRSMNSCFIEILTHELALPIRSTFKFVIVKVLCVICHIEVSTSLTYRYFAVRWYYYANKQALSTFVRDSPKTLAVIRLFPCPFFQRDIWVNQQRSRKPSRILRLQS